MIDKIINEWTYQLDAGYPTKESDYEILRSVLQETNMLSEQEINQTVRQAKGVNEQPDLENDVDADTTVGELTIEEFTSVMYNRYINAAQEVSNLNALYNYITKLPQEVQEDIKVLLVNDTPALTLENGQVQLTGTIKELYDAIDKSGVKVKNGHPSELWFAIIFKGDVAGAVGGEEGIESDVNLRSGEKISLKAYTDASFDFGTLDGEAGTYLKKFESIAEIVTGVKPRYSSMTAPDINRALENLSKSEIQNDLKQFLALNSDIALIEKVQNQIQYALGSLIDATYPEKINKIDEYFCEKIDQFIQKKLGSVTYWGFIINKNILYLRDVESIYSALKCRQHPTIENLKILSPGVANFKGGKLFVYGGPLDIFKKFRG